MGQEIKQMETRQGSDQVSFIQGNNSEADRKLSPAVHYAQVDKPQVKLGGQVGRSSSSYKPPSPEFKVILSCNYQVRTTLVSVKPCVNKQQKPQWNPYYI